MHLCSARIDRHVILKISRKEQEATKKLRRNLVKRFADRFLELVRIFRLDAFSELRQQAVVSGAVGIPKDAERAFELALEAEFSKRLQEAVQKGAPTPYDKLVRDVGGEEAAQVLQDGMKTWSEQYASQAVAAKVTRVNALTRAQIRASVAEALQGGFDATEAARRISSRIGLTVQGARTLAKFEAALIRKRIPNELADTQQIRELIGQEVEARRARLIKRRGEVIAETEIQDALMAGQRGFWEDAISRGEVSEELIEKQWFTVRDDAVCPICEPLHEVRVGFNEPFISGPFEGQRPIAHPLCRCYLQFLVDEEPVGGPTGDPNGTGRAGSRSPVRNVVMGAVIALASGATIAGALARARSIRDAEIQLGRIIPFPAGRGAGEGRVLSPEQFAAAA